MPQKKYVPKGGSKSSPKAKRPDPKKGDPKSAPSGKQKEKVNLNPKPQEKQIHKILPLLFGLFAFLLFVTLLLNLICNPGNRLASNPSDHLMGVLGYKVSYGLLGVFGHCAILLPLLLLNAAIFWKRWVERRAQTSKLVFSLLFLLLVSAFLHVIYLTGNRADLGADSARLVELGNLSYAGGFLGGWIGYFLVRFLNFIGSYIVLIACLPVLALLLWDFSPRRLIEKIKLRKELRSDRVPSMSEQEAEAAGYHIKLKEKMGALVALGKQENADESPVVAEEDAAETDESGKKLAPMPLPKLKNGETVTEESTAETLVPIAEPEPQPADIAEPAEGKYDDVDAIFPRFVEGKNGKKTLLVTSDPAEVFVKDLFDEPAPEHRPLPPEVPLEGGNVDTTPLRTATVEPEKKEPAADSDILSMPTVRKADLGNIHLESSEDELVEPIEMEEKPYVFPPVSYLHVAEELTEENEEEIHQTMQDLMETFKSFKVNIKEINYSCGPTVTRYEVTPGTGVRVKTITGLAEDIALSLATSGVRMEGNIPGKNAVGVEVPNKHRATVYLRGLIESEKFIESKSRLTACLGADIAGHPVIFDIASMPHLLIAGTTGSGKSVCINSIILSLLYKARPDEVKLVLIDPKKVEFSVYRNIPHLLAPIITTPKDAAGALQAAAEEMDRRYEVFSEYEVQNLKQYYNLVQNDPELPFLPQIVIVIDELADLMMTASNEVELTIVRIAQKARAAGIHLIVGTQRPSVDVVTGLIKANIPSRIAFTVSSQVDSRTILDMMGAEKLTGKGDMLFSPIGATSLARVQGTFVSDEELRDICDFIRTTNGYAVYDENFIKNLKELAARCGAKKGQTASDGEGESEGESDAKYTDAVRVAIEAKKVSTSLLQRKLQIGYSRAAKIIDRMESEGIVSPPDGAKPRSVLITPEEYMNRFVNVSDEEDDGDA